MKKKLNIKEYLKKNGLFILTIISLSILMFYYIDKKQGFHEDEMFSYGSSNYKYDNVYQNYGDMEWKNDILYNQVLQGNIINRISNVYKYITNIDSFTKNNELVNGKPVWKSKDKALEYLAIQDYDILSFFSIYYNQAKDVHPPLFYFLVHIVSCLFYNTFSKYIIFSINLIFFIGTLIIISKILNKLDCKYLRIPSIILYGASIGCISTVMFQRMYMMLTFFSILYLYHIINYIKNDFKINKKIPFILTIIGGFLTQYYDYRYCIISTFNISYFLFLSRYR